MLVKKNMRIATIWRIALLAVAWLAVLTQVLSQSLPKANDTVTISLDDRFVFVSVGKLLYKLSKKDLKIVASNELPPPREADLKVFLDVWQVDVREALRMVAKQTGISYSIDPKILGSVSLAVQGVGLHEALSKLLRQVNANFEIEGGIYQFRPIRGLRIGGGPLEFASASPSSAAAQEKNYIYLYRDGSLYKIGKADLKTVAFQKLHEVLWIAD
jgi:hypothetical protein